MEEKYWMMNVLYWTKIKHIFFINFDCTYDIYYKNHDFPPFSTTIFSAALYSVDFSKSFKGSVHEAFKSSRNSV